MYCKCFFYFFGFDIFLFDDDLCKQKFLILIRSNLSVFIGWWVLFGIFKKEMLTNAKVMKPSYPFFFFESFIALPFTLSSTSHLEFPLCLV